MRLKPIGFKPIGHYRRLVGYPDIYSYTAVYAKTIHPRLGLQVLVRSFDALAWINISAENFRK